MLRWTRWLLRWTPPWSYGDGAGPWIVEGGPRRGVVAGATGVVVLAFPLPFPRALTLAFAAVFWWWGQEGEEAPEDMMVPAAVVTEAAAVAEGALLLRAWSRTRMPVPGPPSCPALSPRV
jgi:hypothetical protein